MKRAALAACTAAFAIGVPAAVGAPHSSSISITASPSIVLFGSFTQVHGHVNGTKASFATVTLQAKPSGSHSYTNVANTTASSAGNYSFNYVPTRNTQVRTVAKTSPTATSPSVFVGVRVKVGLSVGTLHPARGQKVRFSGIVNPAFNGMRVQLQRRTPLGRWSTIARATLFSASPGTLGPRSQYFRRLRINTSGTWRALFIAPTGWLSNNSRTRTFTVH
jgi:hypothetical protein